MKKNRIEMNTALDAVRHKILNLPFENKWQQLQHSGKIVFTNGCFDILHYGHIIYLAQARQLGDLLVIGLNSDASVRRLKGPTRPVNPLEARAFLLAALQMVDFVIPFEEDTPYHLITQVKPDILVKGGDYTVDQIAGADFVQQQGGTVQIIPFVDGFSTTSILHKLSE